MKRMKILVLLLCAAVLTACGGGDVRNVQRSAGPSEMYSQAQIKRAMDTVVDFFQKEFDGCTLTKLEYDESKVGELQKKEAENHGAEVIVLLAEFDVDASGGDGSLNPNSTYRKYKFTLTRTMLGWEIRDWGYG